MRFESLDHLAESVGADLGRSRSITIDQKRIDSFADVSEDHQWIHIDPVQAAAGPFGTTIAHGYLTLSLIAPFLADIFDVDGVSSRINYGLDRVRFPAPVPVGSTVSATGTVQAVEPSGSDVRANLQVVIELADNDRPACVANIVVLLIR